MLPLSLKKTYKEVPKSVKQFVKRALILFLGGVFVYHLFLKPKHIPNLWLTNVTTEVTAKALNIWYSPGFSAEQARNLDLTGEAGSEKLGSEAFILLNGRHALLIADGCNALALIVLYTGFLLCMQTTIKRMIVFALTGVAVIFILNIARLYLLTWLSLTHPSFFDFAHHYAFTLVVYSYIFGMWVWYGKKYTPKYEVE